MERPGRVLPARLLLDVVRALPSGDVTLELRPTEQDVEVVSGAPTFHIRTLRAEDFPRLPEPGGDDASTCRRGFRRDDRARRAPPRATRRARC